MPYWTKTKHQNNLDGQIQGRRKTCFCDVWVYCPFPVMEKVSLQRVSPDKAEGDECSWQVSGPLWPETMSFTVKPGLCTGAA